MAGAQAGAGSLITPRSAGKVLGQLKAPIVIVIIQDDENRLKLPSEAIANHLEDRGEVLVRKISRK